MEKTPDNVAYLEACKLLVEGNAGKALELLLTIPRPVAEQPEVRLAVAKCYAALDRRNAAFRIVSALQAAHGPGPWSNFLQELFEQPATTPAVSASLEESRAMGGRHKRLIWLAQLAFVLLFAAGVTFYLWQQPDGAEPEEAEEEQWEATVIERPLEPLDLLARMNDPKRVTAIFYALAMDVGVQDVSALSLVLSDAKSRLARICAAQLLGAVGEVSGLEPLIKAAESDPDPYVRRAATFQLRNFPHDRAYRVLASLLLNDPLRDVRLLAAAGLSKLKGRGANALLEEAINIETAYGRLVLERMAAPENRGTRPPLVLPGEVSAGVYRDTYYLVYTPTSYRAGTKSGLLLALHADEGDSEVLMGAVKEAAEAHGCVAIAPFFDYSNYDYYRNLNLAPSHVPVDTRLLDIVSAVGERISINEEQLLLFGYGDGGSVAVRFTLAHPDRVKRVAVYRAEQFAFPERTVLFPNGTRAHPLRPDLAPFDYAKLVEKPIAVLVGDDEDVDVMKGTRRFTAAAQAYADSNGLTCRVERRPIEASHLTAAEAFPHVAEFLLGGGG